MCSRQRKENKKNEQVEMSLTATHLPVLGVAILHDGPNGKKRKAAPHPTFTRCNTEVKNECWGSEAVILLAQKKSGRGHYIHFDKEL